MKFCSQKDFYKNVYSICINNSPKLETTQMFICMKLGKLIVISSKHRIVSSNKRDKLLLHAATEVNFTDVMCSERSLERS